ncbi:TIGR02679 family protein [Actinophytocola glycyrrhizae]|uniref:TIGR02679 family protein n=1 Tax=Actinophytocola glycyrrhizae TaxID=2044873 RepID=A0ABV9S4R0_9PSEU
MIDELLADPGWQRLLAAARRKLERTQGELTGSVGIGKPTEAERRVIIGITGRHRGADVATLRVELAEVDEAVRDACGIGLHAALARHGGPVRNRSAERASEETVRADAITDARERCAAHDGEPWFGQWLTGLLADGTATRLVRRGEADQLGWAAEVLNRLPAADLPLPVLAEWATGNTKALSGTSLATLVLRALALRAAAPAPANAEQRRALWESAGVVVDDLASQVLVLNLPTSDTHVVADWLRDAAGFGIPFRLTLHQLSTDPLTVVAPDIHVCENPAVLRAAAAELGESSAPLICTEGQPSAACHKLLGAARGRIHWRGDFDWTGLRTTTMAVDRYDAVPWHMSTADYLTALETGDSEPLKGAAATSGWDPLLAETMTAHGSAVMEERLIPLLLNDLAS